MKELVLTEEEKELAEAANKDKALYCVECCTTFMLNGDGQWTAHSGKKVAVLIDNAFLRCTCDANLAALLHKPAVKGEYVAML